MFVQPTNSEPGPLWQDVRTAENLLLQKNVTYQKSLFSNVLATIQNVLDTRQPPFRIVLRASAVPERLVVLAIATTQEEIDKDWKWLQEQVVKGLAVLDSPEEQEEFVTTKVRFLVSSTSTDAEEADTELDPKALEAVRAFRRLFTMPTSERLVNYYACGYHKSLISRQGWMYISENYLCFYSYLLGRETKLSLELKDIENLVKESTMRGVLADAIKVVTKDQAEYFFSNFFHRDETYDLLVQLTNLAMERVLKNAASEYHTYQQKQHESYRSQSQAIILDTAWDDELAPEAAGKPSRAAASIVSDLPEAHGRATSSPSVTIDESLQAPNNLPSTSAGRLKLQKDLDAQKRDKTFQQRFGVGEAEVVLDAMAGTVFSLPNLSEAYHGTVYISTSFLAYESADHKGCHFAIPLLAIRRVERNASTDPLRPGFYIGVTLWHKMILQFRVRRTQDVCDHWCVLLRDQLKEFLPMMGELKPFLKQCASEAVLLGKIDGHPMRCLGHTFGYPGLAKLQRDKAKTRYWREYMEAHGRNLTTVRLAEFNRLVRIGLPNHLRGEIWELCSGSLYLRFFHLGEYEALLRANHKSPGVYADEIEKDLNRSLPEYPAYQADEGINALRRVLNAYSWKNPELGYCQAMNIVASALLIYLDEEQAFWMLSVLCDRMVPGYYSSSMYGASLDQAIFEHLVAKTMPMLDTHFKQHDIQLAVACLPWFLTLFINSMPLLFAFRVLDCFFLEGPKVLFQIGLAIFKINGGQLLEAQDDGEFMNVLKTYFGALDEPVHPDSPNPHTRQLTRFHELLYVAYRDFPFITAEMIDNLRRTHQLKIVHTVESFTKRLQLRNLPTTGRFSKQELSLLYDRFHSALYYENSLPSQPIVATRSRSIPTPHRRIASLASSALSPESTAKAERTLTHECDQAPRATDTKPRDRSQMNYGAFKRLMASLATWAKVEEVQPNPHLVGYGPKPGAADLQTVSQLSSATSSPHTPGSQLLTDQAKAPPESQSPNTPTQQGDHHLPSPTKASATSSSPLPLHIASNAGLPTIRRVASRRDAGDWFLSRLFIHFWHRTQNDPLLRSSSTDTLQSSLVASISSANSPTTEQPVDSSASSQSSSGNPLSPAADNTTKADRGASDSEAEAEAVGITDDMTLSLAAVVSQLGHMLHLDMMSLMDYFFQLHDTLGQGDLSREDMYQVSETLLFLFRHDSNDHYLDAVSKLLQRAIQYAEQGYFDMKVGRYVSERDVASDDNSMDSMRQSNNDTIRPGGVAASLPTSPAHPPEQGPARRPDLDKEKAELLQTTPAFALSVSAFRMLLLADELLEAYFDHGFCDTFNVTPGATAGLLGTPPPMPRHIPASASQVGRELFHSLWSGGAKLAGTVGKRMVGGLQQSRRRVESSSGLASQLTHMRSDETLEENGQPFPLGPNEPRMGPLNPPALKTASKAVAAAAASRVATAMVHSGSTSPTDLSASIGHGGDDDGHDQDAATSPDDMMEEVERLLSEMNADEENDAHYTTRAANGHSYSFSPNSHNKGLAAMTERTSPTLAGTQADDPSPRPSSPDEPFDLEDVERLLQGDDDD